VVLLDYAVDVPWKLVTGHLQTVDRHIEPVGNARVFSENGYYIVCDYVVLTRIGRARILACSFRRIHDLRIPDSLQKTPATILQNWPIPFRIPRGGQRIYYLWPASRKRVVGTPR